MLLEQGKPAEAEALARECLAILEKKLPDDWQSFDARSALGGGLLAQKRYAEAEPLLLSGYEGLKQRREKIPAEHKPRLKQAVERLVSFYEGTGRPEQAAEWKKKLVELVLPQRKGQMRLLSLSSGGLSRDEASCSAAPENPDFV